MVDRGMCTPKRVRGGAARAVLLTVALGAAAACSDQGPVIDSLRQVEAARDRWAAHRLDRYSFDLLRVCDCTSEEAGPVTVTVQGTEPVARYYVSGGEVPASLAARFLSVDGLFDLLESAIRAEAWDITVQYDPTTGVPLQLRIDYEPLDFDDDVSYKVQGLPRAPER